MSADLSAILPTIEELSFEDLLILPKQITRQLRVKTPVAPTQSPSNIQKAPLELKVMSWDNWPPNATFRHDEVYDDDGR